MVYRIIGSIAVGIGLLALVSGPASAQDPQVKKEPIQQTSATSGAEMYKTYCAACHGKSGRGDGPAAAELKVPPTDLTLLAKNNGGKYPEDKVAATLRFGAKAPAHGTPDMPTWGPLFRSLKQGDDSMVNLRISNLVKYIKTLQEQ